jgi:subtilase family serine protease
VPLLAALAVAACSSGGTSNVPATSGMSPLVNKVAPQWQQQHQAKTNCPQVTGAPTCLALQVTGKNGITPLCSPSSSCGFTPAQLQAAYNLTSQLGGGSGTKVAVIEAGDLSSASSDLATYRSEYGLGTASFFKYNESGQQSNYPPSCEDYGWCVETALDIDMVSASCPNCTIYLMEAKGGISDFEKAEAEAVTLGATILSNSWICYGSANCGDSNFQNYFNTSGIAYLASSGDSAYNNIGAPSVLANVVAVGGTQLHVSGSNYTETIWNDAGAGCETAISKPSWQGDPGCSGRTDSDVSAESGCSPGVAVYSSLYGGWFGVCGTSVASPFLAGVIALAGNASSVHGGEQFWKAKKKKVKKELHYISSGSDGSCGGSYLCTAGTKQYRTYSGPGGWGTPKTDKLF